MEGNHPLRIAIVTFNENECEAVNALMDDICGLSNWQGDRAMVIDRGAGNSIVHVPLMAQGNVRAGQAFASTVSLKGRNRINLIVTYGCAGAVKNASVGDVLIVEECRYMSLGSVETSNGTETVRLKSVYLAHTTDPRRPMEPIALDNPYWKLVSSAPSNVQLASALAISTDKVVKVAASSLPPHPVTAVDGKRSNPASWTYADGMAYIIQNEKRPVIVDMETYGAAATATGLGQMKRLMVLRVVTDTMTSHGQPGSNKTQRDLLLRGRFALARVTESVLKVGVLP